nr:uncharacterized protein LOC121501828 [Drosophila kikkawai]
MLRGAGKTFHLAKFSDVLVRSWFRYSPNSNLYVFNFIKNLNGNQRDYSFKGVFRSIEPKHENIDANKRARIIKLTARIKSFHYRINSLKKKRPPDESKNVVKKLLVVLKELEKALGELRQFL